MMQTSQQRAIARNLWVLFTLAIVTPSAHSALVSFDEGRHTVSARAPGKYAWDQVQTEQVDETYSVATDAREVHARTDITQWSSGRQALLQLEFSHTRNDATAGTTYSRGFQRLRANADTTFSLSGFYELAGHGAMRFHVYLYDLVRGHFLLREERVGSGVGPLRLATGSQASGVLSEGGRYALWYHAQATVLAASGQATARGQMRLALGDGVQAIAEPWVFALWGLGLAALAWSGRRPRRERG